jgi:hypothetical protein
MPTIYKSLVILFFWSYPIICYSQEQHQAELMPASGGVYSLIDAKYLRDGYRSVTTISERDIIPYDRRKYGMLVYVSAVDTIYQLKSVSLDNSNWVAWRTLGGIIYSNGYGINLNLNAFSVDSSLLSSRLWRQKGIDSLANVALKYSDTTAMLQNYVLGRNNLTTIGSIPFVNSSGVLQQNNSNLFWDDANKYLGIGTSTPTEKLEIVGNIKIPITTTTVGTIKQGSNTFIHSAGTNNFFAGINAGNLTTTGTNQVAIGYNALNSSSSNTNYSVAIGTGTLQYATDNINTAIGDAVMSNAAFKGSYNTGVGAGAMKDVIGPNAAYNVVVGTNAGQNLDGTNSSNAGWNVFMGDWTGRNTTTGSRNTFIGQAAGYTNTTGSNNTFIGQAAGITPSTPTNLTNATAIGYNAQVATSNSLILGGTGANAVKVGIGITAPTSPLTIANNKSITIPVIRLDTLLSGASADSLMLWRNTDSSVRKITASSFINSTAWGLTGNSGTNTSNNFIGTTDGNALTFKVNNQKSGQISPGAYSTSLGYQSLSNSFLLVNNHTAIGYSALANNTTGSANTAVGVLSLSNNSNGSLNTATGYWSLSNNQSGSNNTAYGFETLTSNTTGNDNTALGFQSLYNSNSSFNTALGSNALYNNTSGNNNIGIGNKAGYNVSTGSNNIVIGANQDVATSVNSNQMNIAGLLFGTNLTGNQTAPSGYLGIGTANPTSRLTVANSKNTTVPILKLDTLLSGNFSDSLVVYRSSDSSIRKQTAANFINNTAWGLTGNSSTNSAFNFLGTTDNHPLLFKTAGTTKLFIDSATNNVGIGTTTPANIFHVYGTNYQAGLFQTNTDALLQVSSTTYSNRSGISFSGLGGWAAFTLLQNSSNQTLSLIPSSNINTTPIWTILSSGYLGIKSTNPTSPLTVANSKSATIPIIKLDTLLSGNYIDSLVVYRSSDSSIRKQSASNFINNTAWGLAGNSSTNSSFNFLGTTDNHPLLFKTSGTTKLFIDSATNNVGIGTITPTKLLDVHGTSIGLTGSQSTGIFSIGAGGGLPEVNVGYGQIAGYSSVAFGHGNNLANGNASQAVTLGMGNSIGGDNGIAVGDFNTGFNSSILFGFGNTAAAGTIAIGNSINNNIASSLQIGPNDASKLTILSGGSVGIGVTTPSAKLDISDITLAGSGALSGSILNLAQTWNTTGVPTAIKLNVTNTASGSGSNIIDLQTNTNSRFLVDKNGNTAINSYHNQAPGSTLDINTNSSTGMMQLRHFSNNGNYADIAWIGNDGSGANQVRIRGQAVSNVLQFMTSNTVRTTLDGNGNFGIGNTTPSYKLDVTGKARFTDSLFAGTLARIGGTSSQYLMADGSVSTLTNPIVGTGNLVANYLTKVTGGSIDTAGLYWGNGNLGLGTTSSTSVLTLGVAASAGSGQNIDFSAANGNNIYARINGYNDNTNGSGHLALYTNQAGIISEQMRIDSVGRVGIGNAAPDSKLLISTNANILPSATFIQTPQGQGTDHFSDVEHSWGGDYSGNVTSITTGGDTRGAFHAALYGTKNTSNMYALIGIRRPGSYYNTGAVSTVSNGNYLPGIAFAGQAGSSAGVGTLIGASILGQVDNTVTSTTLPTAIVFNTSITNATGLSERMRISSSGNVGVNNSTPNSTLSVNGSLATAVATKVASYNITAADHKIFANASAGDMVITLPSAIGAGGREYYIKRIDGSGNLLTLASAGGTIDGANSILINTQYDFVQVTSDNTNWYITGGKTVQSFGGTTLFVSNDSYVNQVAPTINYGTALSLKTIGTSGSASNSLILFDVSAIPSASVIHKAVLNVWANTINTSGTLNYYLITSAWSESTVNWNTAPTIGSLLGTAATGTNAPSLIQLDITSTVQGWINGTITNYGIEIQGVGSTNVFLRSKESTSGGGNMAYITIF